MTLASIQLQRGKVPISFEEKRNRTSSISVWVTNCGLSANRRSEVLQALNRYGITFDSYGPCWNNANPFTENRVLLSNSTPARYRQKISISANYMFMFAAENADCAGYHTEKIYHALAAGTIPVYLGATTVASVVPKNSYIHYRDFANVSALANHLKKVMNDRELYESYHAWRKEPFDPHLIEISKSGLRHPNFACEICLLAHQRPHHIIPRDDGCVQALDNKYFA